MRKYVLIIVTLVIFAGYAAAQSSQKLEIRLGQERSTIDSKLTVRFLSVVEDSRCPVKQTCVWAGNAKVRVRIWKQNHKAVETEINSGLDPRSIRYLGYSIKLVNLSPRPGENVKAIAAKSTAIFEITKL